MIIASRDSVAAFSPKFHIERMYRTQSNIILFHASHIEGQIIFDGN